MQCTVLLFAQLAETIGRDQIDMDLTAGATVNDLLDDLASNHTIIATMRSRIAVAVNEAYAPLDASIKEGDVIALIPPVSGG